MVTRPDWFCLIRIAVSANAVKAPSASSSMTVRFGAKANHQPSGRCDGPQR